MPDEDQGEVFSTILDLEDQYHAEGYALGVADGAKSGRVEGRIFGLEKGFEKYVELGRLQGRANAWQHESQVMSNERLKRHVDRLASLTAPEDMSTENNEEAVNETEDKIRDAKGKERIIRKILGEDESLDQSSRKSIGERGDLKVTNYRNGNVSSSKSTRGVEMEDFTGLPTRRNAG